jgi:hypothetical protein
MSHFPEDFNYRDLSTSLYERKKAEKELKVKLEEFREDVKKVFKGELNMPPSFLFPEETPRSTRDSIAFELHEKFPGKVAYFYRSYQGGAWKPFDPEYITKSEGSYVLILGLKVEIWKQ